MLNASSVLRNLIGILLLLAPGITHGEGFLDFAVGGSFTQKDDVTFKAGGAHATTDADFDESFATGVRGGYWFDGLPWLGVGGMVSYFEPDVKPDNASGFDTQHFGVVPITALLMLRAPLFPTTAVPHGQLQPYLNIGPGAFVTVIDDNDYHYHDDDYGYDDDYDDDYDYDYENETSVDIGIDVHAGATWMFTSRLGMFGEYRFTHYTANLDGDSDYYEPDIGLEATLDTHHVMVGFAWHFD